MSLRLLSDTLPRLTGSIFSRKYISLGRIVTQWKEIVGPEMALRTQPVKIRYRKGAEPGKARASIDIAATSADAVVLQYRTGVILEKINAVLGPSVVESVRFVHIPANAPLRPLKKKRVLTEDQKKYLSGVLAEVDDPDIKTLLEGLGSEILSSQESGKG